MHKNWSELQRRYFDFNVAEYEHERARRTRAYARKARILAAALADKAPERVLEIGAGSGLVTTHLSAALPGAQYVAFDLSYSMVAAAQLRCPDARVRFCVGDACATGFAGEQFDAIVGVDIVHHLADPVAALRELSRIARPNACLALLETNPYHPVNLAYIGAEHELRLFLNSQDNLRRWAQEAGWKGVRLEPTPTATPSGPPLLGVLFDALDWLAVRLPGAQWFVALWLLTASK